MRWALNSSVTFAPEGVVSSRILSHVPDPKVAHPEKRNKKREMVNAFKFMTGPLNLSSMRYQIEARVSEEDSEIPS